MISIIIPIYNEEKNIQELLKRINNVLGGLGMEYEIIAVNDGSGDDSKKELEKAASENKNIRIIGFTRNFGQTAAIAAGIEAAKGEIIVLIDSDLENDPKDIPGLLKKLDEGYDVVSGWRKDRWQGSYFTRKLPSRIANWLISKISGLKLHDYGCTLKAYKKEVIKGLNLYGEMHRFIPAYAYWQGAKVAEIKVDFHPRQHGQSKYGMIRTFKVILDLVMMRFLDKYMARPIHFFGGLGFIFLFLGVLIGLTTVVLKIIDLRDFVETPLPTFSVLLIIVGVLLIVMGILAEMMMRTYYESQKKKPYTIKDKINFN